VQDPNLPRRVVSPFSWIGRPYSHHCRHRGTDAQYCPAANRDGKTAFREPSNRGGGTIETGCLNGPGLGIRSHPGILGVEAGRSAGALFHARNQSQGLETIYPGSVRGSLRLRYGISSKPAFGEIERHTQNELEREGIPKTELFLIDRLRVAALARNLFDRIQLENLRAEKNRHMLLLEDRWGPSPPPIRTGRLASIDRVRVCACLLSRPMDWMS
jgi:hypothetical protein